MRLPSGERPLKPLPPCLDGLGNRTTLRYPDLQDRSCLRLRTSAGFRPASPRDGCEARVMIAPAPPSSYLRPPGAVNYGVGEFTNAGKTSPDSPSEPRYATSPLGTQLGTANDNPASPTTTGPAPKANRLSPNLPSMNDCTRSSWILRTFPQELEPQLEAGLTTLLLCKRYTGIWLTPTHSSSVLAKDG